MSEQTIYVTESEVDPVPPSLPTVEQLSSDFEYLLSRNENTVMRLKDAVEYGEHLRALVAEDTQQTITLDEARKRHETKIFVSSFSIIAKHQTYRSTHSKTSSREERFDVLKDLLANKREMQGYIQDYLLLNYDKSSAQLYQHLNQLVMRARQLVFNGDDGKGRPVWGNSGLLGMLAESKVVDALKRRDWPQTTHSSIEQDVSGVDVVVPKPDTTSVGLQVKCVPKDKVPLKIVHSPIPKVFVPMDPAEHDPFRMTEADAELINQYMHEAPTLPLKLAA